MRFPFSAGVVFFCGMSVLCAAPLDDKLKAFEEAVKAAPDNSAASSANSFPRRAITVEDLEAVVQQGNGEDSILSVVSQMMAVSSSDKVKRTGEVVVQELMARRKERVAAYESKASIVLKKIPEVMNGARKAADLDGILKDLQGLQNPRSESVGSPDLVNQISQTFQFVTQWQDYLSASESGDWPRAQQSLREILNNRQLNAPSYFPRSEILAKLEEAGSGGVKKPGGPVGATSTDPDVILPKVKRPEDFSPVLPQLYQAATLPGQEPWDWSPLITLDKARLDAEAGLPMEMNFNQVMNGAVWGDDISRITAMQLLRILPYYFSTNTSRPPKDKETLVAYLDRLATTASTTGDLWLLQRVIAVKVALSVKPNVASPMGIQRFLAGLSQDAAEQYAAAVVSYENALKQPDEFLPVKIVGERLAAIKAAHPDEFEKGLTSFMTPSPINPYPNPYPNSYPFPRPGFPPGYPGSSNEYPVSVLPIPGFIAIPARANVPTPAGPAAHPQKPHPSDQPASDN